MGFIGFLQVSVNAVSYSHKISYIYYEIYISPFRIIFLVYYDAGHLLSAFPGWNGEIDWPLFVLEAGRSVTLGSPSKRVTRM